MYIFVCSAYSFVIAVHCKNTSWTPSPIRRFAASCIVFYSVSALEKRYATLVFCFGEIVQNAILEHSRLSIRPPGGHPLQNLLTPFAFEKLERDLKCRGNYSCPPVPLAPDINFSCHVRYLQTNHETVIRWNHDHRQWICECGDFIQQRLSCRHLCAFLHTASLEALSSSVSLRWFLPKLSSVQCRDSCHCHRSSCEAVPRLVCTMFNHSSYDICSPSSFLMGFLVKQMTNFTLVAASKELLPAPEYRMSKELLPAPEYRMRRVRNQQRLPVCIFISPVNSFRCTAWRSLEPI